MVFVEFSFYMIFRRNPVLMLERLPLWAATLMLTEARDLSKVTAGELLLQEVRHHVEVVAETAGEIIMVES